MRGGNRFSLVGGWRTGLVAAVSMLIALAPVRAHHQRQHEGANIGVAIPAITHGEMAVVANYRADILDLAARQPRTDPTLRRLIGFVRPATLRLFLGARSRQSLGRDEPFQRMRPCLCRWGACAARTYGRHAWRPIIGEGARGSHRGRTRERSGLQHALFEQQRSVR